jgi:LysR family hydrogen peroxide-inducible transcriptional activator
MNIRDLGYLVALADTGHFGRAAELSFVSQPTLSAQLKKLEDTLGVQLIERTSKGAIMTRVGAEIAERARAVLEEVRAMKELARNHEPDSGPVNLGVFPTLGPYLLPHAVPRLRRSFPKAEWYLVEEKTDLLIGKLEQATLDCALLAEPVDHEGFDHASLFREPFVLAAPYFSEQSSAKAKVADLRDKSLLLLEDGHCLRDQALAVCARSGATEMKGFRATSLETLRQMVAAGIGSTLLPMLSVVPPVPENPDISITRFGQDAPARTIALYWRKRSARASFFKAMAETVRQAAEPWLSYVA